MCVSFDGDEGAATAAYLASQAKTPEQRAAMTYAAEADMPKVSTGGATARKKEAPPAGADGAAREVELERVLRLGLLVAEVEQRHERRGLHCAHTAAKQTFWRLASVSGVAQETLLCAHTPWRSKNFGASRP